MRDRINKLACAVATALAIAGTFPASALAQSEEYQTVQTERPGTSRYIVKPGDTLYSIARSAGVPMSLILRLNPRLDPRYVSVGDAILVPGDFIPVQRQRLGIRPEAGSPDTQVQLIGRGFAPYARLRAMAGRSPYDLRRIDRVRADARGRVYLTVDLPEWARPGRNVFFALQGMDGQQRAIGEPFRVTGRRPASDRVSITGTIVRGGAECPLFRSDDGRRYSLAGDTDSFGPGDRVLVEGRLAQVSICMQGPAIEVRRISDASD